MRHPAIRADARTISRATGLPLSDVLAEHERQESVRLVRRTYQLIRDTIKDLDQAGLPIPEDFERRDASRPSGMLYMSRRHTDRQERGADDLREPRAVYRARCVVVREPAPELPTEPVGHPRHVADMVSTLYGDSPQEVFLVFHLNTRHEVTGFEEVSRGTLDAAVIGPREVFRSAIISNAAAVIVAHVHPSGDPSPSAEDRVVTRKLAEAGEAVGIRMLDHVVVGAGSGEWVAMGPTGDDR